MEALLDALHGGRVDSRACAARCLGAALGPLQLGLEVVALRLQASDGLEQLLEVGLA